MLHTFYLGDVRVVLKQLPDNSVNCVVTSPPYFGLRDYGVDGQIGLEKNPHDYVREMVDVFSEVKRVLREDGTLWLNIGDSYASTTKGSGGPSDKQLSNKGSRYDPIKIELPSNIKPKDLMGIPWRVALALQDDGWYLRSDIIWEKPNAMPESVKDRPTKAHEYLFLLTKSQKYYYDVDSIAEPSVYQGPPKPGKQAQTAYTGLPTHKGQLGVGGKNGKRNKRTVWSIPTKPYKGAHFATFPEELVEPCIMAGCPQDGTVLDPFGGSGTVSTVAERLGRNSIYIDLNPNYLELALDRVGVMGDAEKHQIIKL